MPRDVGSTTEVVLNQPLSGPTRGAVSSTNRNAGAATGGVSKSLRRRFRQVDTGMSRTVLNWAGQYAYVVGYRLLIKKPIGRH